jgi:hypothetical protein
MTADRSPAVEECDDRADTEYATGAIDGSTLTLPETTDLHVAVEPQETPTPKLTTAEAERLTERIKLHARSTWRQLSRLKELIDEAQTGQAHITLGYPSWTAYLKDVLGELHLQLDRDDRRDLVGYLSDSGMSTRAIAGAVNVSKNTVTAALQLSQSGTPGSDDKFPHQLGAYLDDLQALSDRYPPRPKPKKVVGTDGKSYPRAPKPAATAVAPVVDEALYKRSTALSDWREILTLSTHGNFISQLAHDAADADVAGDNQWLEDAEQAIRAALDYGERLLEVISDPEARERGRTLDERDDLSGG